VESGDESSENEELQLSVFGDLNKIEADILASFGDTE
jgi:hypothetical protein